jgi:PAS domain S-box-containing protein
MGVDAWSEWAGTAPDAAGTPPVPAGPPELEDLHEQVVTHAARLAGTSDALLWLADHDVRRLVVRCGTGRFSAAVGRSLREGEGLAGQAWQAGRPLATTGQRSLPDRPQDHGGQQGVGAALCVPMAAGGSMVGVIGVAWSEPGRVVGQAELELLRGWSELAGVVLARAARLDTGPAQSQGWLPGDLERYRALSEQIPAVLYSEVHTPGGAVIYHNPQNQGLLGHTPDEAMQPDFWKTLLHPDDREWVLAENERCERTGDPWHAEYRVLAKDGRVVWLRDHALLVRGERGEPDHWQGYYIDITEQKQAEAALRQALEREQQAVERERQAARQLRALDEMKNTFLDAVSHELRTPLATVVGVAKTLKRAGSSLDEEETADLIDRLVNNADKLDRLLGEPVVARVDPAKVERVVENLLTNAGRHTTPDTPVWVTVTRQDDGVLLAVEDAGAGVPQELRVALFEPFRQGPEAAPHAPGVGIGLSLVARFAELHGGRAWVQDRPGGGASFQVLLPDPADPADDGGQRSG